MGLRQEHQQHDRGPVAGEAQAEGDRFADAGFFARQPEKTADGSRDVT